MFSAKQGVEAIRWGNKDISDDHRFIKLIVELKIHRQTKKQCLGGHTPHQASN